ncbi:hypothetical protein AAMO2058_000160100 [Amorphochlora amoebiformis]
MPDKKNRGGNRIGAGPIPEMKSTKDVVVENWLATEIKIATPNELEDEFKKFKAHLSVIVEKDKINWKLRVLALERLQKLVKLERMRGMGGLVASLLSTKELFNAQVLDRRSSVLKKASETCVVISQTLRDLDVAVCPVESYIALTVHMVTLLFKVVPVTIKVMHLAACKAIEKILDNSPDTSDRKLLKTIVHHTKHKHEKVRAKAFAGLTLLITSTAPPPFPFEPEPVPEEKKEEKELKREEASDEKSKELSKESETKEEKADSSTDPIVPLDPVVILVKDAIECGVEDSDSNARKQARSTLIQFVKRARCTGAGIVAKLKPAAKRMFDRESKGPEELKKKHSDFSRRRANRFKRRTSWKEKEKRKAEGITIPVLLCPAKTQVVEDIAEKTKNTSEEGQGSLERDVEKTPSMPESDHKKPEDRTPTIGIPSETQTGTAIGTQTETQTETQTGTKPEVGTLLPPGKVEDDTSPAPSWQTSEVESPVSRELTPEEKYSADVKLLQDLLDLREPLLNQKMLEFLLEPEVSRLFTRFITRPKPFPSPPPEGKKPVDLADLVKSATTSAGDTFTCTGWIPKPANSKEEEKAVRRSYYVMRLLTDITRNAHTVFLDTRFNEIVDELLSGFLPDARPNYYHLCKTLTYIHRRFRPKLRELLATKTYEYVDKAFMMFQCLHEPLVAQLAGDIFFPPHNLYFDVDAAKQINFMHLRLRHLGLCEIVARRATDSNVGEEMINAVFTFLTNMGFRVVEPSIHDPEILLANCHSQVFFEKFVSIVGKPWELKATSLVPQLVAFISDPKRPSWHRMEVAGCIERLLQTAIQAAQKIIDATNRNSEGDLGRSQADLYASEYGTPGSGLNQTDSNLTKKANEAPRYGELIRDAFVYYLRKDIHKLCQAALSPEDSKKFPSPLQLAGNRISRRMGQFRVRVLKLINLLQQAEIQASKSVPEQKEETPHVGDRKKVKDDTEKFAFQGSVIPLKYWSSLLDLFFSCGFSNAFLSQFKAIFIHDLQQSPQEINDKCAIQHLLKNCDLLGRMIEVLNREGAKEPEGPGRSLSNTKAYVIHLANHLRLKAELQSATKSATESAPIAQMLVGHPDWTAFHDNVVRDTKFQEFDHWDVPYDAPEVVRQAKMHKIKVGLGSEFASKLGYKTQTQNNADSMQVWGESSSDEDEDGDAEDHPYLSGPPASAKTSEAKATGQAKGGLKCVCK